MMFPSNFEDNRVFAKSLPSKYHSGLFERTQKAFRSGLKRGSSELRLSKKIVQC